MVRNRHRRKWFGRLTEGHNGVNIGDTEKEHAKDCENVLGGELLGGGKEGAVVENEG